jgi:GT2 family glycosyltransferase
MVAIIVLTWNQRDFALDCLASLAELDYPAERLQIIVVDNGSIDGTAQAVEEQYCRAGELSVTVLVNDENLGFAEGNNVGIRRALEGDAEYVMLLNNDTAVDPFMLNELLAVTESSPRVGIVGPKMLYFDEPDRIWCAGNQLDWRSGESIRLQAEQRDNGAEGQRADELPREADFITACAIFLRRQVIEEIGLLDPRFFIYYEETDWCMRARAAGWQILYVPRARMWHKVSAAMGTTSPATAYYMSRNVLLFVAKNRRGLSKLWSLARVSARNLRTIAAYTAKPHAGRRRPNRDACMLALRDAVTGRWGKMGPDVAAVCYPAQQAPAQQAAAQQGSGSGT